MTPSGIEPATFRFVAQHLNHCATAVPQRYVVYYNIMGPLSYTRSTSTGTLLPSARLAHDVLRFASEEHMSLICLDNVENLMSPWKEVAEGKNGGHA